jgi:hypothetical protein
LDAEEQAYRQKCLEIEWLWSLGRGRHTIVSPIEFAFVDDWIGRGIPVSVVERAMQRFFERKKKLKRQRPYLLTALAGDVEKAFEEYARLHVGGGGSSWVSQKINRFLVELHALAPSAPDGDLLRRLCTFLESGELSRIPDYESMEACLMTWDEQLLQSYRRALGEELAQGFRQEVTQMVSPQEDGELFARLFDDFLRYHFSIPRLSILG